MADFFEDDIDSQSIVYYFIQNFDHPSISFRLRLLSTLASGIPDETSEEDIISMTQRILRTFNIYQDKFSRNLIESILSNLLRDYSKPVAKTLFNQLKTYSNTINRNLNSGAAKSFAASHLTLLKWSCLLSNETNGAEIVSKLIPLQCILNYSILLSQQSGIILATKRYLKNFWKRKDNFLTYQKAFLNTSTDINYLIYFVALFCEISLQAKFKTSNEFHTFCVTLEKDLLAISTLPSPTSILNHTVFIVHSVTHDDFQQILKPLATKYLLRSAEISIYGIEILLKGLKIDLSNYSLDLMQSLGNLFSSNNDILRSTLLRTVNSLLEKISDLEQLQFVLRFLMSLLTGSQVKLILWQQRCDVIRSFEGFLKAPLLASKMHIILNSIVSHLFTLASQEIHESCQLQALTTLRIICQSPKLKSLPDTFTTNMKKFLNLNKNHKFRINLLRVLEAVSNDKNKFSILLPISPLLSTLIEKSIDNSTVPIACEGLSSTIIQLRLLKFGNLTHDCLNIIQKNIQYKDNLIYLQEKYFKLSNEDGLHQTTMLAYILLSEWFAKLDDKTIILWCKILAQMAINNNFNIRKQSLDLIQSLNELEQWPKISAKFITILSEIIGGNVQTQDSIWTIPSKFLFTLLKSVTKTNNKLHSNEIAKSIFILCHKPSMLEVSPPCWFTIVRHLPFMDFNIFLSEYFRDLWSYIVRFRDIQDTIKCVETLLKIYTEQMVESIYNYVTSIYTSDELLHVTEIDYHIYKTPQGELYDSSVIPTQIADHNIKRESKLYSVDDQKWDMQMKAQKTANSSSFTPSNKKTSSKNKPKQNLDEILSKLTLTSKQRENINNQLKLEENIRKRLTLLDSDIRFCNKLLLIIISQEPIYLIPYLYKLIPNVTRLFTCPIAASHAIHLFIGIGQVLLPSQPSLRFMIGSTTVRLSNTFCKIPLEWCSIPLDNSVRECLKLMSTQNSQSTPLSSLSYIIPLLNCVLFKWEKLDSTIAKSIFDTLSSILIFDSNKASKFDVKNLEFIPLPAILYMVVDMANSTNPIISDKLKEQCMKILVSLSQLVAHSSSTLPADVVNAIYNAFFSSSTLIRLATLNAATELHTRLPFSDNDGLVWRILVLCHDPDEQVKTKAKKLWTLADLFPNPQLVGEIPSDILHLPPNLHFAYANAITDILKHIDDDAILTELISELHILYTTHNKLKEVIKDDLGRLLSEAPTDNWEVRLLISRCLTSCTTFYPPTMIVKMFKFLIPEALSDRNVSVREEMRNLGLALVSQHSSVQLHSLLDMCENSLNIISKTKEYDDTRTSIIILYASLSKSLDQKDPKIKDIIAMLLSSLDTPSQKIQEAVANCLPPLISSIKDKAGELIDDCMQKLLESPNYGVRRGGAYGIAGLVKGLGIISIGQFSIMDKLLEAVQDKKNPRHRESALFAFETLSLMLMRLFEPYVKHILPHLLIAYGDSNLYVREAAFGASRIIMNKLSGHGVKQVLPSLLEAVEDESWRTKVGSVELLGSMAYCAPKQLSQCLPIVVPKLMEILVDSHTKVQIAGKQALEQIGSVIKNPEIQKIVPQLIDALKEPAKFSNVCLESLISTSFVHMIDPASLALVMPIIARAFQQRSTETKKMASEIMGNLNSLTDEKDLRPYLDSVIPGLKEAITDPVPQVRHLAAVAIGAIIQSLGDDSFELFDWLKVTMLSDTTLVDRSGAAEGLCEVLRHRAIEGVKEMLPEMVEGASLITNPPYVRDGYLTLFIYLPTTFQDEFIPFLGQILPCTLLGLADECEYIRETSMKVAQGIVQLFANEALVLFLSKFEQGLEDENWRIRCASVQLIGDLLYRLAGITGKMSTDTLDDDDSLGNQKIHTTLTNSLGPERRDRILASIYICRADVALMVRQAAIHVWKVVIINSARTLRDILGQLLNLLFSRLASLDEDKRISGARTLGDLVRKLGEKIVVKVLPVLESGLESDNALERQGVCIGLTELLNSTAKEQIMLYLNSLVSTVNTALCDTDETVRQAAAQAFSTLHTAAGVKVLSSTMQHLFKRLDDPQLKDLAYDGLKQLISVKSNIVLPFIVPKLMEPPINATGIVNLVGAADEALNPYINQLLTTLIKSMLENSDGDQIQLIEDAVKSILICAANSEEGVSKVLDVVLVGCKNQFPNYRIISTQILYTFLCESTLEAVIDFYSDIFRTLFSLLDDPEHQVWDLSWQCIEVMLKPVDVKNEQESLDLAKSIFSDYEFGLCISSKVLETHNQELICFSTKGVTPFFNLLRPILQKGTVIKRKEAAECVKDIMILTNPKALSHQDVLNSVGALMRILSQRFDSSTMIASLSAINIIFEKVDMSAKQFFGPVQTTAVKLLAEDNIGLRSEAIICLNYLASRVQRLDPIVKQLIDGYTKCSVNKIKESYIEAIKCYINGQANLTPGLVQIFGKFLINNFKNPDENLRALIADAFGMIIKLQQPEETEILLQSEIIDDLHSNTNWEDLHAITLVIGACIRHSNEHLAIIKMDVILMKHLIELCSQDNINILTSGIIELAHSIVARSEYNTSTINHIIIALNNPGSQDIRKVACEAIEIIGNGSPVILSEDTLKIIVPILIEHSQAKFLPLRNRAEHALVAIFKLRQSNQYLLNSSSYLDQKIFTNLHDVYKKTLEKII